MYQLKDNLTVLHMQLWGHDTAAELVHFEPLQIYSFFPLFNSLDYH